MVYKPGMKSDYANVSLFLDRHGQVRWRFRKRGLSSHYFDCPIGTPEFEAEWQGCFDGTTQAAKRDRKTKPDCPGAGKALVYFIGAATGPVKIGHSRNIAARIETIQWGSPERVSLLATAPGGQAAEAQYHKRFYRDRLNREWFRRSPEIEAEIEILRAQMSNLGNG